LVGIILFIDGPKSGPRANKPPMHTYLPICRMV
jgi:hypothetical protein